MDSIFSDHKTSPFFFYLFMSSCRKNKKQAFYFARVTDRDISYYEIFQLFFFFQNHKFWQIPRFVIMSHFFFFRHDSWHFCALIRWQGVTMDEILYADSAPAMPPHHVHHDRCWVPTRCGIRNRDGGDRIQISFNGCILNTDAAPAAVPRPPCALLAL